MVRHIESYTIKMQHVTSNGWNHLLEQTCYRCTSCGAKWEPTYYGQDSRWWDGSWEHKCPKDPVVPPVQQEEPKVKSFFDDFDF